jgi:hypothetical protein
MVTILPPATNIGVDIGRGVQSGLQNQFEYQAQRSRLGEALGELDKMDVSKLPFQQQLAAYAKALLPAPGGAQVLSELIPVLKQNQLSKNQVQSTSIGRPGAGQPNQPLPQFLQGVKNYASTQGKPEQPTPYYPNVVGETTPATNYPQKTATQPVPFLTPEEMLTNAKRVSQESQNTAHPISLGEAYQFQQNAQESGLKYNEQVQREKQASIKAQERLGSMAADLTKSIFPAANETEKALFERYVSEAARRTENESEIKNEVSRKISNYKTVKGSVDRDISRPDWLNNIYRKFTGTDKSREQAMDELRTKVKPLIAEGMYDEARQILAPLEYGPVEIESIISDLSPQTKTYLKDVSAFKSPVTQFEKASGAPGLAGLGMVRQQPQLSQENIERLKPQLQDIFRQDPGVNLVLLRDRYQDKNVNWHDFSSALTSVLKSEQIKLTDDQQKQFENISKPPLNGIYNIFQNLFFQRK